MQLRYNPKRGVLAFLCFMFTEQTARLWRPYCSAMFTLRISAPLTSAISAMLTSVSEED